MPLRVYVAAPFVDAPLVREVHGRLLALGMEPTSTWATHARGSEDTSSIPPDDLAAAARMNDDDLLRAQAVLVLARGGVGGEMFAEARFALIMGKRIVWVGRRILSAYRAGVVRAEDLDEALVWLHSLSVTSAA